MADELAVGAAANDAGISVTPSVDEKALLSAAAYHAREADALEIRLAILTDKVAEAEAQVASKRAALETLEAEITAHRDAASDALAQLEG